MKYFFPLILSAVLLFASCVKDRTLTTPTTVNNGTRTVIDYWNFNGSSFSTTANISNVPGDSLHFDFATVDDTTGYADFLSPVTPTTNINAQNGDPAGNALRVRNPCTDFIITAPTTGYKDILVSYAEAKSSNGPLTNTVSYTIDGSNYITYPGASATYTLAVDPDYTLETFDFTTITGANNNPLFKVKITFSSGNTNTSGNDRFDNLTIEGNAIGSTSGNIPLISSGATVSGTVGSTFTGYTITASNTPTSFAITGIPAGLSINTATGAITGTPTIAGKFVDTIKATNASGTGTQILTITINPPATIALLHYWNFNNNIPLTALLIPTQTIGGGVLNFDFTTVGTTTGYYDSVASTATSQNAQNNDIDGYSLRVRNPCLDFIITAPTTGYKNIVVKYAEDESSSKGASDSVYYTIDGTNYINAGISADYYTPSVDPAYTLYTYDFSAIPTANNNPNFKVKIVFVNTNLGISGNDRFDNLTVQGFPQ
jgi:hypothetical protein